MAFKAFESKKSHSSDPAVTITKNGLFVLNSACVNQFFKGVQHAKLYWDDAQHKVGIKPMKKKDHFSYNISKHRTVGTLSGISFVKSVGIEHKETKPYPASWDKKEQLLVFSVGKGK